MTDITQVVQYCTVRVITMSTGEMHGSGCYTGKTQQFCGALADD
jgi:hypothetical protein